MENDRPLPPVQTVQSQSEQNPPPLNTTPGQVQAPQPPEQAQQPKTTTASGKRILIIIIGVVLVIAGGQGLYAQIKNHAWFFAGTLFNVTILALGLVLIQQYTLGKK